MTMATTSLKDWTSDNVGKWLSSVNLGYLAVKFETLRIDGMKLMMIDDSFIETNLRLNPAERTAFTGALLSLRNTNGPYGTYPSPRSTTLPSHNKILYNSSGPESPVTLPRLNSDCMKKVKIHHQTPESSRNVPEVKIGPASELLKNCRHSGWIRKQGGSHKGFRQRYMVLRLGHLYYYDKETSLKAKGYFSIQGYRVEPYTEVYKGKPWCFKLVPDDPNERTYVVSTGAQHEMNKWMQEIQDEIFSFEDHVYDPVAIEELEEIEDDFEDDDENYVQMDNEKIYDDVDDDVGYVRITPAPAPNNNTQTFPRSNTSVEPPLSPKRGSGTPQTIPRSSHQPTAPPRSVQSLGGNTVSREGEESPYIQLIDSKNRSHATSHVTSNTVDHTSSNSPLLIGSIPTDNGSPSPLNNPHPPRRSTESIIRINRDPPPPQYTEEEISNENPYYIKLGDIDDIMPSHCLFSTISREEAVRRLTMDQRGNAKYTRPGTYLIRDSSHQDVLHVLSVWTGTECKHYKLFSKDSPDEGRGFCLTQGKMFPTIPLLLSHYKQECLPKSPSITLNEPYHPLDH